MELVIRVHAKPTPTRQLQAERLSRGDVVAALPDGHPFSERELTNPAWRIVRVPLTQVEAEALVSREIDQEETRQLLFHRQYRLDLDDVDIPQALKNWLANDERRVPILDLTEYRALFVRLAKHRGRADDL